MLRTRHIAYCARRKPAAGIAPLSAFYSGQLPRIRRRGSAQKYARSTYIRSIQPAPRARPCSGAAYTLNTANTKARSARERLRKILTAPPPSSRSLIKHFGMECPQCLSVCLSVETGRSPACADVVGYINWPIQMMWAHRKEITSGSTCTSLRTTLHVK